MIFPFFKFSIPFANNLRIIWPDVGLASVERLHFTSLHGLIGIQRKSTMKSSWMQCTSVRRWRLWVGLSHRMVETRDELYTLWRLSIRWSVLGSNLASAVRLETNRHPHGEPSPGPVKVSCNGLNVKIDGGGNVNFCWTHRNGVHRYNWTNWQQLAGKQQATCGKQIWILLGKNIL